MSNQSEESIVAPAAISRIQFKNVFLRYRREFLLAGVCLLLGLSPHWYPDLTWLLLGLTGFLSSALICQRLSNDAFLVRIVVASYVLRAFVATALFVTSAWQLPILSSLHADHGLWIFGGDGIGYHGQAVKVLEAWALGTDLPSIFRIGETETVLYRDLSLPLAALYKIFGVSPLHFTLLNAWFWSMTTILSYRLVRMLTQNIRPARLTAGLIAFWPSSILWSSQILKDSVVALLIVATLSLIISIWTQAVRKEEDNYARVVYHGVIFILGIMALAYFRFYMGYLVLASIGVVMAIAVVKGFTGYNWRPSLVALGLLMSTGAAVIMVRSIDWVETFSPASPEKGYVRQGRTYHQQGDLERAAVAYRKAIELNPDYAMAYQHLSLLINDQEGTEAEQATVPSRPPRIKEVHTQQAQGSVIEAGKIHAQLNKLVHSASAEGLNILRQGMINAGGHSLVDEGITFTSFWDVFTYIPRSITLAFLSPLPRQWFHTQGETGIFRLIAAGEVILILLLIPAMLFACWNLILCKSETSGILLGFVVFTAVALGLTVANVGILFRLRLQFLIPLFIIIGIGGVPAVYQRFFATLSRTFRLSPQPQTPEV